MTEDSELVEKTLNTTQGCLLPKFIDDFDKNPISSSDFESFKIMANENIHHILDILYQNRCLLMDKVYDNQIMQIRVNLLLITCEQVEENPYFHSEDEILLQSLWKITSDHFDTFEDKIFNQTIQHYKESLTKNDWKKQFGLFHGFPLFCKIMLQHKSNLVTDDFLLFMLSVGSHLVSHYEPYYKNIGMKIYMNMLQYGSRQQLKELNIHQVIYSETFPLIERSNDMNYNIHLYECIYRTLTIENLADITNRKWCKYDDVMSKIIKHFSFENEVELSKFLIYQIARFCGAGYGKTFELRPLKELKELDEEYLEELTNKFDQPNYCISRWVIKIQEMMIRESLKLLNNADDTVFFLYVYNIIYMLSIGSMRPADFEKILEDFTKKLILILMKVVKNFKGHQKIVRLVLSILSIIERHQCENEDLLNVLKKIRCHEMLKSE